MPNSGSSFVLGELACGSLADRAAILELLRNLPAAVVADEEEVLGFIERHGLHGKGGKRGLKALLTSADA